MKKSEHQERSTHEEPPLNGGYSIRGDERSKRSWAAKGCSLQEPEIPPFTTKRGRSCREKYFLKIVAVLHKALELGQTDSYNDDCVLVYMTDLSLMLRF